MQIRLKHIQFTDIKSNIKTLDKNVTSELETSLKLDNKFFNDNLNEFHINFVLILSNSEKTFNLDLNVVAQFRTKEQITDEMKKSPFFEINAPAIAFPYVRTFISNLTLNMGYNPIILPTFNFVELSKRIVQ